MTAWSIGTAFMRAVRRTRSACSPVRTFPDTRIGRRSTVGSGSALGAAGVFRGGATMRPDYPAIRGGTEFDRAPRAGYRKLSAEGARGRLHGLGRTVRPQFEAGSPVPDHALDARPGGPRGRGRAARGPRGPLRPLLVAGLLLPPPARARR